MRVKTKNAITINTSMTSSVSDILYMSIGHYVYSNNFNKLEVDGKYYYEVGSPAEPVVVKHFSYTMSGDEIDTMFASLGAPTATDKHLIDQEIAYMAGLKVMSSEYGIAEIDLEIEA